MLFDKCHNEYSFQVSHANFMFMTHRTLTPKLVFAPVNFYMQTLPLFQNYAS